MTAPKSSETTVWALIFGAWLVASVATLGALFFSEVMHVAPCVLCWYQRIFMFPLVLVLPLGLFPLDRKVIRYALPLACLGGAIGAFHLLLIAGVIPEEIKPCMQGIPCTEQVIEWFGFVTIPLMSFVGFLAIIALLVLANSRAREA